MLKRLRRLFNAPLFDDANRSRLAGIVVAILRAVLAGVVLGIPVIALLSDTGTQGPLLLIGLAGLAGVGVSYALVQRGQVRLAAWTLPSLLVLVLSVGLLYLGGLHSPAVSAYLVIITAAGLLLGPGGAVLFTAISSLAVLGLWYLEAVGLLVPAAATTMPLLRSVAIYVALFGTITGMLYVASRRMQQGVDAARDLDSLLAAEKRRAREMELLAGIARHLTGLFDLSQLMDDTVQRVSQDFGYEQVSLLLVEGEALRLKAKYGVFSEVIPPADRIPLGRGIIGWVGQTGQPYLSNSVQSDPHFMPLPGAQVGSELVAPLRLGKSVIGVLDVLSHREGTFDSADVNIMQAVADLLATALQSAQLLGELRTRERLAEALRRAGQAVSASLELPVVLRTIGSESHAAFEADATVIWMVEAGEMCIASIYGVEADQLLGKRYSVQDHQLIAARAVRERRPIIVNHLDTSGEGTDELRLTLGAKAVLAIPIIRHEEVFGAMVIVDRHQPERFSPQDAATGQLLSVPLATAIFNARLFTETQQRARQLALLNDLAHDMTGLLDVGELCQQVARALCDKLGYYSAGVFMADHSTQQVVLTGAAGAHAAQVTVGQYRQNFGQGLIGVCAQTGQGQVVNDITAAPDFYQLEGMEVRSEVALPLKAGDRVIAVLTVSSDRAGAFSPDDLVTLYTVADQLAVALDKARYFAETQQRAQELAGLYDTALATSGVLETDALLRRLSDHVQSLIAPDALGLALYDKQSDELEVVLAVEGGRPVEGVTGLRLPLFEGGLTGWVIANRQPLILDDLEKDPLPAYPRTLTRAARAWMGVPLIAHEAVIGALSVQSFRPGAFTERDRFLVMSLASHIAIALENAQLYQSVQQQAVEIGALYRASGALINPGDDLATVALNIAQIMTAEFDFGHCDVRLVDEAGTGLTLVAQAGSFEVSCPPLRVDGRGIVAEAARVGSLVYYADVSQAPSYVAGHSLTRSELAVPLLVGNRLIGVLNLESPEPDAFPERSRRVVSAFAERAALALDNARLVEAERQRAGQLSLLYDVSRQVTGTLDAETICNRATEALVHQFGYAEAAIMLPVGDNELELSYNVFTEEMGVTKGFRQRSDRGVIGRAVITRGAYVANDVSQDPYYFNPIGRNKGSALAIPLLREQSLVGVLYIESSATGAFSEADVRALETLASHIATALVNAQLYRQVNTRLREMTGLQSMSQAVASSLELKEILEAVVLLLHNIFGYRYVSLALVEGEVLKLAAQIGFATNIVYENLPITQGISGRAVRTGRPQHVRDVTQDPDYLPGANDVDSEIAVPLVKDQEILGVLNVGSPAERVLTEADVNLLITLAGQVTVAIENARLFQAEREQRELAEVLRTAGIALSTSLSYDTLLDLLLDQIGRLVPYDSACFLAVNNGVAWAARLRGYEQYGEAVMQAAYDVRMEISQTPGLQRMTETLRPLVMSDTSADPLWVFQSRLRHIRSWAGAPIVIQGRIIAFFSLEMSEPGYYQPVHAARLAAFAGHAALALQNARLFEAAEQRAGELEGLRQASLSLTSSLEPRQVLGAILDGAFRLLPGLGNAHIFLYQGGQLSFGAARWSEGEAQQAWSEPRPQGLTYTVARSGQPVVIPNMTQHPLFANIRSDWVGAIVGLPLKIGSRVVGVMNVSYPEPRELSESELRLLRLLGDQAAVAIENGRLFQSEREQRGLAEALRDAARTLNSTLDLSSILDRLLEELAKIIPHDSSSVMMIEGSVYRVVGGRGLPHPDTATAGQHSLTGPLARELNEKRRPLVLADASADPRFERWGDTGHVRGWIGVPLISRDTVIGALTVDSRQAGAYNERDADIAFAFAGQAAIAIENARLYEHLQARAEMLTALNATALDISIPHDLQELLHTIVERAARLLQAPGGCLYVTDAERREVRCVASYNLQPDRTGQVLRYSEGAAGKVTETGEPLILLEPAASPDAADPARDAQPPTASISVPMTWQGRVIGVIHVEDAGGQRQFGLTDLETLTQFARQAAIAVENARLLDETQSRADEQHLLFDAARDFTAGLDESGVLQAVARHMLTALKVYDCAVSKWDRANDRLITLLDYDETDEPNPTPPGTIFALADYPVTRRVLETRQPLMVRADSPPNGSGERDLLNYYGHGVELMVPLAAGERVYGLVELYRPIGAPLFTEEDIELAQSLAAQAGAALENASLHAAVSERARELDALVTANTALLSTLDLDRLLRNILQAALDALPPAEKGAILLVDPQSGALAMRAVIGYRDPRIAQVRFAGQAGYSARALRERQPQFIEDAWADASTRYTGDIVEMREVRAAIAVPLIVNNEASGVLSLDSTKPGAFSEADLRLLVAFATTAAAAIDNAQLHAEVQTLAITDSLTSLTNRRAFDRALETELSRAVRYGYPLTLIILDIDNFKVYNDTYGHPAGDRRLMAIAELLRDNVRDPDLAARYGGEEFGLILPHTDKIGALTLAERVRSAAATAAAGRGAPDRPIAGYTLSLGVATYPYDASTAEELLEAADSAELEAKRGGKNRVCAAPELTGTD